MRTENHQRLSLDRSLRWLCNAALGAVAAGAMIVGIFAFVAAPGTSAAQWPYQPLVLLLALGIAVALIGSWVMRAIKALNSRAAAAEQVNQQLLHMMTHDPLTGLPNRSKLIATMRNARRDGQTDEKTFMLLGVDDFKSLNDQIGREQGDRVLMAVAQGLQSCFDEDEIVARICGDEFAMVTHEPAAVIIRRVMDKLGEPIDILGRRMKISVSIGHLTLPQTPTDPVSVLADAAIALRMAKSSGGNRACQFTTKLRDDAGAMKNLQLELPDAITNGELEPWFQPQVRLSDGALHGVEVLARWRHPTRGLLTPDRFLPAAERAGLMIEMDHAIWQAAMAHAFGWQQDKIWRPVLSLNAAPETIADPYLVERFLLGLQKSGLSPDQIIVEVLETTIINGSDDMAALNIDSLAECGVGLELDDFGTGYASLAKLPQLPLSGIKLDKSLVAPLPDDRADSVVRAILALAAELGLQVIAEGIEESGQARHLIDRGCAVGQGYGFARPMPALEFRAWLGKHARRPVLIDVPTTTLAYEA